MNRVYRVVWSRPLGQLVVASELANAQQGGMDRGGKPARLLRSVLFAAMLFAGLSCRLHAQDASSAISNISFESGTLSGWTAGGGTGTQSSSSYSATGVGVSVVSGMTGFDSTHGGDPGLHSWTVTPYGSYMASLQAGDASAQFSTGANALGLSSASQQEVSTLLSANGGNGTPTNAAWMYQDITLTAGQSFTMAWQYVSTDYTPYNDGSLTSLVNLTDSSAMATVNNLSAQYALLGATNPGTGNYSTDSYGATGWEVATYSVSAAGTYRLGFLSFNLSDTENSPILLVDQAPGQTFDKGVPFAPIAPNAGSAAPVTPTATTITSPTDSSTLTGTDAVIDGGSVVSDGGGTVSQNFGITDNGGTVDNAGTDMVLSGTLSDAQAGTPGSLTVTNSGTGGQVTLTGTNTYTGGTQIDSGSTLALSGSGSIADSAYVIDNGTLDISGANGPAQITTLAGSGGVTLGGNTLDLTGGNGIFNGVTSGNGGLTLSGGTEQLGGANTYTGATQIDQGTWLGLTGDGSVAHSSAVIDNGTFDISGANGAEQVKTLSGSGTVILGDNNLELTNANDTFTGQIGGNGGNGGVAINSGSETLTGYNVYTGATQIDNGATLALAGNGSIAGSSGVIDNGTFDITGANGPTRITTLSGSGDVALGGNDLELTDASGNFAGTMGGEGGVTLDHGTQALSGNNSYAGGTTLNGGTLQVSSDTNLGDSHGALNFNGGTLEATSSFDSTRDINLLGPATVDTDTGVTLTDTDGAITGSGGLGKTGAGTLVLGTDNGSGGVTVGAGKLQLTGAGSDTGAVTIDPNATLALTGDGSVANASRVTDNGLFDISGANAAEQVQSLSGNGAVTLGNNDLNLTNANDTFAGSIGGGGGVSVTGGSETLSGANTYTGITQVADGGSLMLSGNGSVANSAGLVNNGTFDIGGANGPAQLTTLSGSGTVALGGNELDLTQASGSFGGTIGGNGGLAVTGSETLTGTNTYDGVTRINSGSTLALTGNGSVADSSRVIDNGTFDIGGANGAEQVKTLTGNGTVALGGNNLELTNANDTFAGSVGGTGGITVGGGNEALSGVNTYSGATQIDHGGTLALSGNGSIGQSSGVLDNGMFDIMGANGPAQITTLSGNGSVALGSHNLELTDASGNFAGTMGGSGGIVLDHGTQVLSGNNTYTGGSTLNGGTLQVGNDANLGDASGALNFHGGTLEATSSFSSTRALNLQAPAIIDTDAGVTLTDTTGPIAGNGGLTKNGAGTLVLGADNGTGGIKVAAGTLQLTGAGSDTGVVTIDPNATLALTGNGSLAHASNVIDNGTFDISGGNGTAQLTTLSGSGSVGLGDNSLELTHASGNFAGSIGGHGGLVLDGGTQVLSGNNSYAGGTTLNGGTLQVSSDANLGQAAGAVTFNGGTLSVTQSMNTARDFVIQSGGAGIDTASGVTLLESGDISGSGGLVKLGGGTLVVSGNNTFTGGTLIDGGVVKIDTGSSLGTGAIVLNGGTLQTTATLSNRQNVLISGNAGVNVDAGTTASLSGNMQAAADSGCFVKSGLGKLDMTGTAVLPNGTCVAQGILSANGSLASDVQVYQEGELRGTGAVNGGIDVKGRLAPGNSPGTLAVNGNVTMHAGSSFEVDIDGTGTGTGAGNYSRLLITGDHQFTAAGTIVPTLRGITGNASNTFTPSVGDIYRVIYAQGGIVGHFDAVTQPDGLSANTRMVAFYSVQNSNSIDLGVLPSSYATLLQGEAATGNAKSVAGAVDKMAALQTNVQASDTQSTLLYSIAGARASQLGAVLNSLAGDVHADEAAAARNAGLAVESDAMGHLREEAGEPGRAVWANVTHDGSRTTGDAQASGYQSGLNQMSAGVDLYANNRSVIGVGGSHQENDVISSTGRGTIRGNALMAYGQQAAGAFVFDGVASYGQDNWRAHRTDPSGIAGNLQSRTDGSNTMAALTVRLPMNTAGMRIEPYASAIWQHVQRDGFTEQGDSPAVLQLGNWSASGSRVLAGLSVGSLDQDPLRSEVTYRIGASAGVDSRGLLSPTVQATLADEAIQSSGPRIGQAFANVQASGTIKLDKSAYLYGSLSDEAGSRRSSYSVTAGVRVTF
jgi:fibronectin-binding autotransporter adhesin